MGIHQPIRVAHVPGKVLLTRSRLSLESAFGSIERAALRLADMDGASTVLPQGRFAAAVRRLLFDRFNHSLADPRLETLRRLGVLLRLGMLQAARREAECALSAGFSPTQIAALRAHYDRARKNRTGGVDRHAALTLTDDSYNITSAI